MFLWTTWEMHRREPSCSPYKPCSRRQLGCGWRTNWDSYRSRQFRDDLRKPGLDGEQVDKRVALAYVEGPAGRLPKNM